ncbi:MAG TPA: hypothetical protein VJC05_04490 [Candidatus Andersenbacteria bacterium]|nr:hypothetical protein [Candidatus Andersenbacteria bacterium]
MFFSRLLFLSFALVVASAATDAQEAYRYATDFQETNRNYQRDRDNAVQMHEYHRIAEKQQQYAHAQKPGAHDVAERLVEEHKKEFRGSTGTHADSETLAIFLLICGILLLLRAAVGTLGFIRLKAR